MTEKLQLLTSLRPGETAMVQGFSPAMPADCRRLLQHLGITRNTEITLIRCAPLGDPLQLKVLGSQISLRKSEARYIHIKLCLEKA
ncbi:MAG: ferrous iron transport protein A [Coxiellaceae bacterium]|nr:MAG: ferrous iron transport protein A [Coxiellaceae bacterium]